MKMQIEYQRANAIDYEKTNFELKYLLKLLVSFLK